MMVNKGVKETPESKFQHSSFWNSSPLLIEDEVLAQGMFRIYI